MGFDEVRVAKKLAMLPNIKVYHPVTGEEITIATDILVNARAVLGPEDLEFEFDSLKADMEVSMMQRPSLVQERGTYLPLLPR